MVHTRRSARQTVVSDDRQTVDGKENCHDKDVRKSDRIKRITNVSILIRGKTVQVTCGNFYFFSLFDYEGVLKVEEVNISKNSLWFLKARYYVLPQFTRNHTTYECHSRHGQDELIEYEHLLLLSSQTFREGYRHCNKTFSNLGTKTIATKHVEIDRTSDVRLKKPVYPVKDNISALNEIESGSLTNQLQSDGNVCEDVCHAISTMSINVVDYERYCLFRKLIKALQTGVAINANVLLKYPVVSDKSIKTFFTRKSFSSVQLEELKTKNLPKAGHNRKRKMTSDEEMDRIDDEIYKRFRTIRRIF